jgi:predicted nucleotidyltransferase
VLIWRYYLVRKGGKIISKKNLKIVFGKVTKEMKLIFGDKLKAVLVYGSYARGDYNEDSDIDIFVLVDIEKFALSRYRTQVNYFASRLDLEYDIFLSIKLQDLFTFEYYREALPYYRNISAEGVPLIVK